MEIDSEGVQEKLTIPKTCQKLWEYGMISCDLGVHLKSQGQGYLPVLQQLRLHRRKVERSGQPRRLRSKQRRKAAWVTRLAKLDIPQKSYRFFLVSPVFNLLAFCCSFSSGFVDVFLFGAKNWTSATRLSNISQTVRL